MTIAEVLQDERQELMALPKPFDGYVEQPVRVSSTSLIQYQRNLYSVPTPYAHRIVSLHSYPDVLVVVADGVEICRHTRSYERYQTIYDWQHYIPVVAQKPGALRNGAPFMEMPDALRTIQRHLLKHEGGDKVMAQVLASVPMHGLDAVLVAVELALESGRPSGEHVLNVLGRLKETLPPDESSAVNVPFKLKEEPAANVNRYDHLRAKMQEASHVD